MQYCSVRPAPGAGMPAHVDPAGAAAETPPPQGAAEGGAAPFCVLYGSQTGTAEQYAGRVARRLRAAGWRCLVGSLDDFGWDRLQGAGLAAVVVATTGDGDPPDNMRRCWARMRRRDCPRADGLRYAVFGLGDSGYEKYNYVAKMFHNRLKQLGAAPLVHRGLGDEQDTAGLDEGFAPWMDGLLASVGHGSAAGGAGDLPPRFSVEVNLEPQRPAPTQPAQLQAEGPAAAPAAAEVPVARGDRLWAAAVTRTERITAPDHFQDVRHVELAIGGVDTAAGEAPWATGGSVGLFPRNPPKVVSRLLARLGLSGEAQVQVSARGDTGIEYLEGPPACVGRRMPLATLFACHLDLCGTPGRSAFELLARWCPGSEEQQQKLAEMGSASEGGMEDLRFYCTRERRTYVEVLCEFPAVSLPLDWLLELIPPLRPRLYSVSSAPPAAGEPAALSITVGLVEYQTPYGRPKQGVCSQWLAGLPVGAELQVIFRPPLLSLPADPSVPVVLVGPGTGIAPCRAVIQQLRRSPAAAGNVALLVGCRNRAKDYLYGEEWAPLEAAGWLRLGCAFSRDQPAKVYVQHVIRQTPELRDWIAEALLRRGGHLYISGSSKNMPDAVQRAVVYAFTQLPQERGGVGDEPAARAALERLKKEGRLQLDTWS